MQTNDAGLALIKEHEGLRLEAYPDPGHGWTIPTIGVGHTSAAGEPKVTRGMTITAEEAEAILQRDLAQFERAVTAAVTVPLTGNQFAALVSFTFNLGAGNLRSSTLLRKLNAGDYSGAAEEFPRWNRSNGSVLSGLARRRAAEQELFLTPDADGVSTLPSTPLSFGSDDPRNRDVQVLLRGLDLYRLPLDTKWGPGQHVGIDALREKAARLETLIQGE
ncbi:lysozyme [Falsirhodobacter sp. 1013]|uniref:lysozyme n=1 Tax=Falsirhodobacter sp. 1013 TaxID=3417566 RepID=UPI003EBBA255